MGNIPDEIMNYNILTRLPLKSILRFKCVSKNWYSLITSSTFINHHQLYRQHSLTIIYGSNNHLEGCYYLFRTSLDHPDFILRRKLDIGIKNYGYRHVIIGCSNGFFCYLTKGCRVFGLGLCNPFTGERRSLMDAPDIIIKNTSKNSWIDDTYGFGYDSVGRDFKIVKFSLVRYHSSVGEPNKAYVQVYSLRQKSWKFEKLAPPSVLGLVDSGVVINNNLHWTSSSNLDNGNYGGKILTFNLHNEDFEEMALPVTRSERPIELMECSGLLFAKLHYWWVVSLWVMKEYGVVESWTNICQINPPGEISGGPRVVTYRLSQEGGGEILFSTLNGLEFVWYNLERKTVERVRLPQQTHYSIVEWMSSVTLASINSLLE